MVSQLIQYQNIEMINVNSNPLISIIIASYNHEKFVTQAIESVLNQTYKNIEIIVIDDGSSDKTPSIVNKIKDNRLKLIKLYENRKYHPRNIGIEQSHGEFIAFQNSDDVWLPNKLAKQIEYLNKHQQVGAIFNQIKLIDENNKISNSSWATKLFTTKNRTRIQWLRQFFTAGNCLCISSSLIRKSILNEVGNFNESLFQLSDMDLWVRIAGISELYIFPEILSMMRITKNKNYSAPSISSLNRGNIELIQIFHRYSQKPIIDQIGKIFPGLFRSFISSNIIQQCRIIQKCWKLGGPVHILFAIQLADKLLEDAKNRNIITTFFGSSFIKNHILMKGQIGFISSV